MDEFALEYRAERNNYRLRPFHESRPRHWVGIGENRVNDFDSLFEITTTNHGLNQSQND